jgi:hypothetical protein
MSCRGLTLRSREAIWIKQLRRQGRDGHVTIPVPRDFPSAVVDQMSRALTSPHS